MTDARRIPLARPEVGPEAEAAVVSVLRSGHLVRGRWAAALEEEIRERVGSAHALTVSSGTAALQVALVALGVGRGDEVVLPDFTFPSLANAVELCGATPVTVDVSLETFNAEPETMLAAVTGRTRAIVVVHQFGLPAEVAPLEAAAGGARFSVIEDAACALGASRRGSPCGSMARVGCFSLHPRKLVTTGEGGAVVTDDEAVFGLVSSLTNHGLVAGPTRAQFARCGWNYRMSDVQAAVAAGQMDRLDEQIAARRRVAAAYVEALEGVRGVIVPKGLRDPDHIFQSFVVLVEEDVDRDAVIVRLRAAGVESNIGSYAIHLQPHFAARFGSGEAQPGRSRIAFEKALALPMFPGLTSEEVQRVARSLDEAIAETRGGRRS